MDGCIALLVFRIPFLFRVSVEAAATNQLHRGPTGQRPSESIGWLGLASLSRSMHRLLLALVVADE